VTTSTPVVAGVVRDRNGDPVDAARVYVIETPVALPDIAALTDAAGSFSIGVPVPGRYTVEATADGWAPGHATVEAEPGINQVEIRLG